MKKFLYIVIALTWLSSGFLGAQDTLTKKELRKQQKNFFLPGRPWVVELPIWVPGYAGSFAYGEVNIEGEDGVDPEQPIEPPPDGKPPGCEIGDIFSRAFSKKSYLKFVFLTRIAYEKNKFLFQLDGLAGGVGASAKFNLNGNDVAQVNFRTINSRLFAGYKVIDVHSTSNKFQYELFGYVGTRGHFQVINSDLDGLINKLDISHRWFEPIIGLQNQFTWKRWFIVAMGDYGGYFVGSKNSFQSSAYVYYRSGKIISLKFGWNHLQLNHNSTFRGENLKIAITLSGPMTGIAFHF